MFFGDENILSACADFGFPAEIVESPISRLIFSRDSEKQISREGIPSWKN
jgi:hypothetical protein